MQCRNDAGLGPEILRVSQQGAQSIPGGLKEEGVITGTFASQSGWRSWGSVKIT